MKHISARINQSYRCLCRSRAAWRSSWNWQYRCHDVRQYRSNGTQSVSRRNARDQWSCLRTDDRRSSRRATIRRHLGHERRCRNHSWSLICHASSRWPWDCFRSTTTLDCRSCSMWNDCRRRCRLICTMTREDRCLRSRSRECRVRTFLGTTEFRWEFEMWNSREWKSRARFRCVRLAAVWRRANAANCRRDVPMLCHTRIACAKASTLTMIAGVSETFSPRNSILPSHRWHCRCSMFSPSWGNRALHACPAARLENERGCVVYRVDIHQRFRLPSLVVSTGE